MAKVGHNGLPFYSPGKSENHLMDGIMAQPKINVYCIAECRNYGHH